MARTISQIKQTIIDAKNAEPDLSGLTSVSQTAIFNLWAYIVAVGISLIEQLMDIYLKEVQDFANSIPPGNDIWIKDRVLRFQFSATNPQAVQINPDFSIDYPVVDPTLRIITRCSVLTEISAVTVCNVKVAKGEPPQALSGTERVALSAYLLDGGSPTNGAVGIGYAGINYLVISVDPDKIYVAGNVTYDGQYNATIQDAVFAAMYQWMKDVSSAVNFNGVFIISDLVAYVRAVPGVTDFDITDFAHRDHTETSFSMAHYLIQAHVITGTEFISTAGYAIEEDSSGHTFADSITFTPVN